MSAAPLADVAARLRFVLANMHEVLKTFDSDTPPDRNTARVRIERWTLAIESILNQADGHLAQPPSLRELIAAAIYGADVAADAAHHRLHDLTQIAAVLRPERTLSVANGHLLTPIEQASIATAATGKVLFGDASP